MFAGRRLDVGDVCPCCSEIRVLRMRVNVPLENIERDFGKLERRLVGC